MRMVGSCMEMDGRVKKFSRYSVVVSLVHIRIKSDFNYFIVLFFPVFHLRDDRDCIIETRADYV